MLNKRITASIFILSFVFICPQPAYAEKRLTTKEINRLRSLKTIKIVVESETGLPFERVTRKLLEHYCSVNVSEIDYEGIFRVVASAKPLAARYINNRYKEMMEKSPQPSSNYRLPETPVSSGAIVSGIISMEISGQKLVTKPFTGKVSPPGEISVSPSYYYSTPYNEAFGYSFVPAMLELIGTIYDASIFIAALKDEELSVSRYIAEGVLVNVGTSNALIAALKDGDQRLRWAAVNALNRLDVSDPRLVEPLIITLDNMDLTVASKAATALGKIGKPAVGALVIALKNNSSTVRLYAAQALRGIQDERTIEPLIQAALKDEDSGVRDNSAKALKNTLGKIDAVHLIERLTAVLNDRGNPHLQQRAAGILGQLGDIQAVWPLIAVLGDENKDVRFGAAWALRNLGWKPASDAEKAAYHEAVSEQVEWSIANLRKYWNPDVKRDAAYILGVLSDPIAVDALILALQDSRTDVAIAAYWALEQITGKDFGLDPVKWQQWWEQNKDKFNNSR